MAIKDKKIETHKIVQLIPAFGMNAHFEGKNKDDQRITTAQQIVCIALLDNGHVMPMTLQDITGLNQGHVPKDLIGTGMSLSHYSI